MLSRLAGMMATPYRLVRHTLRSLPGRVQRKALRMARAALMVAVGPIVRNPRARHALQDLCRRHPGLYQKVRLFAHRRGLLATSKGQGPNLYGGNMLEFDPRYLPLSPQAQEIHAQLKQLMPTKDGQ